MVFGLLCFAWGFLIGTHSPCSVCFKPREYGRPLAVFLFLLLTAGSAGAQELPDAPRPHVVDRKFVAAVAAFGGSMAFDMVETRSLLDRGGLEYNLRDFGVHPSTPRLVGVESAYFSAFVVVAYEMKKPHAWIPRPIGRVLQKTWWIPLGLQIETHTRLAFQDRHACRPSCR